MSVITLLCVRHTFFPSAVVTIGFDPVTYSVLEDAGSVNVTVSILNGTLARNVVVTLLISGGTATGKFNKHSSQTPTKTYKCLPTSPAGTDYTDVTITLTFNANIISQMVKVPVLDDSVVEETEFINLALTSVDNAVMLNSASARVNIEDVDSEWTKLIKTAKSFFSTMVVNFMRGMI